MGLVDCKFTGIPMTVTAIVLIKAQTDKVSELAQRLVEVDGLLVVVVAKARQDAEKARAAADELRKKLGGGQK